MSDIVLKTRNETEAALLSRRDRLLQIAPPGYPVDRTILVLARVVHQSDQLMRCDKASLLEAMMRMVELGLDPSPATGQAYIVAYGTTATLIIGYRGWKKLVLDSGTVTGLDAQVVYEGEECNIVLGTDPTVQHVAAMKPKGPPIGAYAVARFADGHKQVHVLRAEDIQKARAASRAKGGPWANHFAAMVQKTAVLRIAKYLPETPLMRKAFEYDEPDVVASVVTPKVVGGLRDAIAGKKDEPVMDSTDGQQFIESLGI